MNTKKELRKKIEESDSYKKMLEQRAVKRRLIDRAVVDLGWNQDDILNALADSWVSIEDLTELNKALTAMVSETKTLLHVFGGKLTKENDVARQRLLEMYAKDGVADARGLLIGIELHKKLHVSTSAKKYADVLHNKPGGSREKKDAIRVIWMAGKYDNRDLCAEQECAALNMSFSSARKALRGIQKPA